MTTIQLKSNGSEKVLLTDEFVKGDQADCIIPEGHRKATLKEVALMYRNDPDFREKLWLVEHAWVSGDADLAKGHYRITDNGVKKVANAEFLELDLKERMFHIKGKEPLAVKADYYSIWELGLVATSTDTSGIIAPVAYVKESPKAKPIALRTGTE
ncbi:MAG: hypothetical protein KGI06_01635 [Candidatus Micrarchaeota archaeon]|nr:hypothetical protein [Candidatus Micrarchaeota archaeon]